MTTITIKDLVLEYFEVSDVELVRLSLLADSTNILNAGITTWDDECNRYTVQCIVNGSNYIADSSDEYSELMHDLDKFEFKLDEPPSILVWFYVGNRSDEYQFSTYYGLQSEVAV